MPEYDFEELAELSVAAISDFIDTETHFIQGEHHLEHVVLTATHIFHHLQERIPEGETRLRPLEDAIDDTLRELQELLENGALKDLKIEQEEKRELAKLETDVRHRDYRAVKADVQQEASSERAVLRLELHELEDLHKRFGKLATFMRKSKVVVALEEGVAHDVEEKTAHYLHQLYKLAQSYERVFKDLWRKEKKLYDSLT